MVDGLASGRTSGAPSQPVLAMLAEDARDVHEEALNEQGECAPQAARMARGSAAGGRAAC
jgi:hypothetical protein